MKNVTHKLEKFALPEAQNLLTEAARIERQALQQEIKSLKQLRKSVLISVRKIARLRKQIANGTGPETLKAEKQIASALASQSDNEHRREIEEKLKKLGITSTWI